MTEEKLTPEQEIAKLEELQRAEDSTPEQRKAWAAYIKARIALAKEKQKEK